MKLVERLMHYTTADFLTLASPLRNYALQIAPDAPFRLYGIAIFPLDGVSGDNNNTLRMRFTKPDGTWMQRELVPTAALAPWQPATANVSGQFSNPNAFPFSPIYPNLVYPPNSVITIDIERIDGTNAVLNCIVVFIGTNVYEDGRGVWNPAQLSRANSIPYFGYNVLCDATLLNLGPVLNVPLNIAGDADFIFQGGVHTDVPGGPSYTTPAGEGISQMTITAKFGAPSDVIEIVYPAWNDVTPGPFNSPLSITVTGTIINIDPATDAMGVQTSQIQDIVAAFNASAAVQALGFGLIATGVGPGFLFSGFDGFLTGGGVGPNGILTNLGVRMKDWNGKYYSNQQTNQNNPLAGFVPAAIMFGFNNGQMPGLVYPEIYLPRNAALYFDFAMLNGPGNGLGQTPILTLKGQKVFAS